jgi:hypothetical protein
VFIAAASETSGRSRLQSITLSSDNRSIGVSLAINEADVWLASLK